MVLYHEWSYKIMNSFYDGYSEDASILMVYMLYLSFACVPCLEKITVQGVDPV